MSVIKYEFLGRVTLSVTGIVSSSQEASMSSKSIWYWFLYDGVNVNPKRAFVSVLIHLLLSLQMVVSPDKHTDGIKTINKKTIYFIFLSLDGLYYSLSSNSKF